MKIAYRQWLRARELFLSGSGSAALDAHCEADQRLLAAFLLDWHEPDPRALALAYEAFRQALLISTNAATISASKPCCVLPTITRPTKASVRRTTAAWSSLAAGSNSECMD